MQVVDERTLCLSMYVIETGQRWREEIDRVPYIQFPADWKIQVIPPFGDAVVRFKVKLPDGSDKSIYLDVRGSLGYFGGEPYWEVYPYGGYVGRCGIKDTEELLRMIAEKGGEE